MTVRGKKNKAARSIIVSAPTSYSGKTAATLSLVSALRRRGHNVAVAKIGPDYIDPAFHAHASGRPCINLDPYAMRPAYLEAQLARIAADVDFVIIEGVMGLFDGASNGAGSTADLAERFDLPVILLIDASRQSQSVAALAHGFGSFRKTIDVAGVILNKVAGERHLGLLKDALADIDMPVFGAIPYDAKFNIPSRHLGLVQACENQQISKFICDCASVFAANSDLDSIEAVARPIRAESTAPSLAPLGGRIAIARDAAFTFAYPHILEGWRAEGASLHFFSPLNNEGPDIECDAVFLPGGYPELHMPQIGGAFEFRRAMGRMRIKGSTIYGECGGYMVLGEGVTDASGRRHQMLGFLPLESDFAAPKRRLGYRQLTPLSGSVFTTGLMGHEYHYSREVHEGDAPRLFGVRDARGSRLPDVGLHVDNVFGSFIHIIDRI